MQRPKTSSRAGAGAGRRATSSRREEKLPSMKAVNRWVALRRIGGELAMVYPLSEIMG